MLLLLLHVPSKQIEYWISILNLSLSKTILHTQLHSEIFNIVNYKAISISIIYIYRRLSRWLWQFHFRSTQYKIYLIVWWYSIERCTSSSSHLQPDGGGEGDVSFSDVGDGIANVRENDAFICSCEHVSKLVIWWQQQIFFIRIDRICIVSVKETAVIVVIAAEISGLTVNSVNSRFVRLMW